MACLVISIIMLSANTFRIRRETIPLIFCFSAVHFFSLISEIINSSDYALIVIFRYISILIFCTVLLNLDKKSMIFLYKICQRFVIFLVVIASLLFLSGGQYGEKFPLLGIYANQSLLFEVNMFGILCYILFFSTMFIEQEKRTVGRFYIFIMSFFGIFVSFYRTVWITFALAFLVRNKFLAILSLTGVAFLIMSDFEKYSRAFKFEQFATLTGRDVLWSAAMDTFKKNPFFGGGEQNISQYIHEFKKLPWDLHSYHSVVFDIIGISGAAGIIGLLLYLLAIIVIMKSVKNLGIFILLYMPALLNTYYLFAPNAVGFFSTVAFLLLVERNGASRGTTSSE